MSNKKLNLTKQQVADEIVVSVTKAVSILQKELREKQLDNFTVANMAISFLIGILSSQLGVQEELQSALEILEKLRQENTEKQ